MRRRPRPEYPIRYLEAFPKCFLGSRRRPHGDVKSVIILGAGLYPSEFCTLLLRALRTGIQVRRRRRSIGRRGVNVMNRPAPRPNWRSTLHLLNCCFLFFFSPLSLSLGLSLSLLSNLSSPRSQYGKYSFPRSYGFPTASLALLGAPSVRVASCTRQTGSIQRMGFNLVPCSLGAAASAGVVMSRSSAEGPRGEAVVLPWGQGQSPYRPGRLASVTPRPYRSRHSIWSRFRARCWRCWRPSRPTQASKVGRTLLQPVG